MENLTVALAQQQLINLSNKTISLPQQQLTLTSHQAEPIEALNLHNNKPPLILHDDNSSRSSPSLLSAARLENNLTANNGAKNKKLFPQKLWDLINDDNYNFCLRWSDDGQLVYLNRDVFEDSYLKTNENQFHTQKAISFVRQMNMYGFRKVDDCYYENDNFKRDYEHLLKNMIRKHPAKNNHNHSHHQQVAQQISLQSNNSPQQFLEDYCCGGSSSTTTNDNDNHHHQMINSNLVEQVIVAGNRRPSSAINDNSSFNSTTFSKNNLATSLFNNNSSQQESPQQQKQAAAIAERMQLFSNSSHSKSLQSQNVVINSLFNQHQNHLQQTSASNILDRLKSFHQAVKSSQIQSQPINNENNRLINCGKLTTSPGLMMTNATHFLSNTGLDNKHKQATSLFNNSNSNDFTTSNPTNDDFNSGDIYSNKQSAFYDGDQQRAILEALFMAQQHASANNNANFDSNNLNLVGSFLTDGATKNDTKFTVNPLTNNNSLSSEDNNKGALMNKNNNDNNLNSFIYNLLSSLNSTPSANLYQNSSTTLALNNQEQKQTENNLLLDFNKYSNLQQICQALLAQQQQQHQSTNILTPNINATYNHDNYQTKCHNKNNNPTNKQDETTTVRNFDDCNMRRQLKSEQNILTPPPTQLTLQPATTTTLPLSSGINHNINKSIEAASNNNPSLLLTTQNSIFKGNNDSVAKNNQLKEKESENVEADKNTNSNNNQQRKYTNESIQCTLTSLTNGNTSLVLSKQRRENKPNRCFKRSIDSILDSNNCNNNKNNNVYIDGVCDNNKKIKMNLTDQVNSNLKDTYNYIDGGNKHLENNYCINKCAKNLVTQVALARDVKLNSNVIEEASIFTKRFVSILFETAQVIARHSTNASLITSSNNTDLVLSNTDSDISDSQHSNKIVDNKSTLIDVEDDKHDETMSTDINLSDLSSAIKLLPSKLLKILK